MLSVTIICLLYGYFFLFVVTVEEICPQRVHAYCFAATVILVYCFFCIFVSIYFSRKHFSSYLAYFRILYCFFAFLFLFIFQEIILVVIRYISEFYTILLHETIFCFFYSLASVL